MLEQYNENDFTFPKYEIFDDILNDQFDITWQKNIPSDSKVFSIIDPELQSGAIDDGSVIYQYNKDFFRCDNFKKVHDGKHILFSGCSETEGVGGNIDDAWSHILYNKICETEKCSGFFNLAKSGWGWNRIITNALIYFKKYGYPDVYFIMLPNHQRQFYYEINDFSDENFVYWQTYPTSYFIYKERPTEIRLSNRKEYLEDFVNFLIGWKTFIELCKTNNVKLIFSTWDTLDSNNVKDLNLNGFIEIPYDDGQLDSFTKKYYKNNEIKKDDNKKRDGHRGRVVHKYWADKFYNKYKEDNNV
jgi:hypothetical protein